MASCWRVFMQQMNVQVDVNYQLNELGQWQWVNKAGEIQRWQITNTSRVAIYGCYLTLVPIREIGGEDTSAHQQFIFKDSLNREDYARLCRVIRRINLEMSQTVLK